MMGNLTNSDGGLTHAEIPSQVSGFENIIHDAVAVCGNLGLSKQIEMVLHDVYMNTVFPAPPSSPLSHGRPVSCPPPVNHFPRIVSIRSYLTQ